MGESSRHLESEAAMSNCSTNHSKFREKMGTIKHDDSKVQNVKDLNKSGHNKEEINCESLAWYQLRQAADIHKNIDHQLTY